eukprot:COSAG01_NODE_45486_length_409_cov_0.661290_1_plen_104_part_10
MLEQLAPPTPHLQQADGVQAHRKAFARTVARAAADWSRFFLSSSTDAPEIGLALTPLRDAHEARGQHAYSCSSRCSGQPPSERDVPLALACLLQRISHATLLVH